MATWNRSNGVRSHADVLEKYLPRRGSSSEKQILRTDTAEGTGIHGQLGKLDRKSLLSRI